MTLCPRASTTLVSKHKPVDGMGVLGKFEDSVSQKLAAVLLAGAGFSACLRDAAAFDSTNAVSPDRGATEEAERSTNRTTLIRPVCVVRDDGELGRIWLPEQKVYVDKGVLERGINEELFVKLADSLAQRFPHWTVYVTTPRDAEGSKSIQSSIESRVAALATKELQALSRFTALKDSRTGRENGGLLLICYGQSDLPTVISAINPGRAFLENGLDSAYWQRNMAPQLGRDLAKNGNFEQAVLRTIADFESALTQRVTAGEAETTAQREGILQNVALVETQTSQNLDKIAEGLVNKYPEFAAETFARHKKDFAQRFVEARTAIERNEFTAAKTIADETLQEVASMERNASPDLAIVLKQIGEFEKTIADSRIARYVDEPGRAACEAAKTRLQEIREDTLALKRPPAALLRNIEETRQRLSEEIAKDAVAEEVAIVVGSAVGIVGTMFVSPFAAKFAGNLIADGKDRYNRYQRAHNAEVNTRQSIEADLKRVGDSLKEKERSLRNLVIAEPIVPDALLGENASPSMQALWVLKKMKEILASAEKKASWPSRNLREASQLINDAPVVVKEQDGLEFLASYARWQADSAVGDPHNYRPPTVTFNELSGVFGKLVAKAQQEDQLIRVPLLNADSAA